MKNEKQKVFAETVFYLTNGYTVKINNCDKEIKGMDFTLGIVFNANTKNGMNTVIPANRVVYATQE